MRDPADWCNKPDLHQSRGLAPVKRQIEASLKRLEAVKAQAPEAKQEIERGRQATEPHRQSELDRSPSRGMDL